MTRTERAAYPRAVERDRSESKSGVDRSIRKGGGGAHNWGSIEDEQRFEREGSLDELRELRDEERDREDDEEEEEEVKETGVTERQTDGLKATSGGLSPQELDKAKALRKRALKSNKVDLSDIARSSQAVTATTEHPISITSDAASRVDAFKDI